jgi:hypothetical protein
MARRVLAGFRLFKDNGAYASDGVATFALGGTSTAFQPFNSFELTTAIGPAVSCGTLGWLPDIWIPDDVSLKVTFTGTGVTTRTIDYVELAESSTSDETGSLPAFKNVIKNAAFNTWSGATTFSNISGAGAAAQVADQWYLSQSGTAANAVSRQTADSEGARYALRFGRPAASSNVNQLRLYTTVATDEAYRLRSKTVTLSFAMKAGANFSAANVSILLVTGTSTGEDGNLIAGGTWGGQATEIGVTQTPGTTIMRYEFSADLPASIGEIGLQLSYTPVGTAGANDWVQIEDVQLEVADAASEMEAISEPIDYLRASLGAGGRLVAKSTFTDPGADRIFFWDFSALDFTGLTLPAAGLAISGTALALANDLAALEGLASTGFAVRSASDTWVQRALAAPAAGFSITNNDGVSGNPTFVLANDLAALEGLGSTGLAVRSASDTWVQRSIAVGTGLSVSNGDGVSGNPTVSPSGRLADVAAVGVTDNAVLIGNGSALVLESGSTLLTSIGLGTGDTPTFTGVNVGNADTTLTRVSAGVAAIEGVTILTTATGAQLTVGNTYSFTGSFTQTFSATNDARLRLNGGAANQADIRYAKSGTDLFLQGVGSGTGSNNFILWNSGLGAANFTVEAATGYTTFGYDVVLPSTGPTSVYSAGYRGSPLMGGAAVNAARTFAAADMGCTAYHDEATPRTWTIDSNANYAAPIGSIIVIDNTGNAGAAGTITLAITTDTLRRGDGTAGTGSRSIAAGQKATAQKVKSTEWVLSGTFS